MCAHVTLTSACDFHMIRQKMHLHFMVFFVALRYWQICDALKEQANERELDMEEAAQILFFEEATDVEAEKAYESS